METYVFDRRINGGRVRVEMSSGKRRSDSRDRGPPRRNGGGGFGGPRGGRESPMYDDYRMPRRSRYGNTFGVVSLAVSWRNI